MTKRFYQYFSLFLLVLSIGLGLGLIITQFDNKSTVANTTTRTAVLRDHNNDHYIIRGSINGIPVQFLVDTGATLVTLPSQFFQYVDSSKTSSQYAYTANGRVKLKTATVKSLTLGRIELRNIRVAINPLAHTDMAILGMSALKKLNFCQHGNALTLEKRRHI
tara:strand:+ start:76561 stop:77049 length:489 start_codon:yes stop_codon:yes gene_type:complete